MKGEFCTKTDNLASFINAKATLYVFWWGQMMTPGCPYSHTPGGQPQVHQLSPLIPGLSACGPGSGRLGAMESCPLATHPQWCSPKVPQRCSPNSRGWKDSTDNREQQIIFTQQKHKLLCLEDPPLGLPLSVFFSATFCMNECSHQFVLIKDVPKVG